MRDRIASDEAGRAAEFYARFPGVGERRTTSSKEGEVMASMAPAKPTRADERNAVLAGFLGWSLDAFDFFILVMVVPAVAKDFHTTVPAIALTLMASLMTRPIGAVVFGLLADRFGRRLPLMLNVVFYSLIAFCSGL